VRDLVDLRVERRIGRIPQRQQQQVGPLRAETGHAPVEDDDAAVRADQQVVVACVPMHDLLGRQPGGQLGDARGQLRPS